MTLGGIYMSSKCLKMKSTLTQGSDLFMLCRDHVKQFTLKTKLFLGRSWRGRVQAEKF